MINLIKSQTTIFIFTHEIIQNTMQLKTNIQMNTL